MYVKLSKGSDDICIASFPTGGEAILSPGTQETEREGREGRQGRQGREGRSEGVEGSDPGRIALDQHVDGDMGLTNNNIQ